MYPKDENGKEYQVLAKWLNVWPGGEFGIHPGWCVMELRRYADGTVSQYRGDPMYLSDVSPAVAALHSIWLRANNSLMKYR